VNTLVDTLTQQGLIDIVEVKATGARDSFQFATCRYQQGGDVQLFVICPASTIPRRIPTRLKGDLVDIITAVTDLKLNVIGNSTVCLYFKAHKGETVSEFVADIL
jgi:hypothetical protein